MIALFSGIRIFSILEGSSVKSLTLNPGQKPSTEKWLHMILERFNFRSNPDPEVTRDIGIPIVH